MAASVLAIPVLRQPRPARLDYSRAFRRWYGQPISTADTLLISTLERLRLDPKANCTVVLDQSRVNLPLIREYYRYLGGDQIILARNARLGRSFLPWAYAARVRKPDPVRGRCFVNHAIILDADLCVRSRIPFNRHLPRALAAVLPYQWPHGVILILGDLSRHPRGDFAAYLRDHPFPAILPPVIMPRLTHRFTLPAASPPLSVLSATLSALHPPLSAPLPPAADAPARLTGQNGIKRTLTYWTPTLRSAHIIIAPRLDNVPRAAARRHPRSHRPPQSRGAAMSSPTGYDRRECPVPGPLPI